MKGDSRARVVSFTFKDIYSTGLYHQLAIKLFDAYATQGYPGQTREALSFLSVQSSCLTLTSLL